MHYDKELHMCLRGWIVEPSTKYNNKQESLVSIERKLDDEFHYTYE